ncbi:hypothetical protein Hanom_Chr12g01077441 [Helianthus anomalus]
MKIRYQYHFLPVPVSIPKVPNTEINKTGYRYMYRIPKIGTGTGTGIWEKSSSHV